MENIHRSIATGVIKVHIAENFLKWKMLGGLHYKLHDLENTCFWDIINNPVDLSNFRIFSKTTSWEVFNVLILIFCTELDIWGNIVILQWFLSIWCAAPSPIKMQNSSEYNTFIRSNRWFFLTVCTKHSTKHFTYPHFSVDLTRQAGYQLIFVSFPSSYTATGWVETKTIRKDS